MAGSKSTKNRIIDIIGTHEQTLTDISKKLDLAPSTVSQHLKELKEIGAIQESDNWNMRKWKYYKLNPSFDYSRFGMTESTLKRISSNMNKRMFFYILGLMAIGTIAYMAASDYGMQSSIVQIGITDPPIVPNGTRALYINYSGVSVHTVGGTGPEWIVTNSSGTINLLSLINTSEILSGVEIPKNSKIDEVSFKINSAELEINGTLNNIIMPYKNITADITSNVTANSTSEIIIDFSPTVMEIYNGGSANFLMIPNVMAVLGIGQKATIKKLNMLVGRTLTLNGRDHILLRKSRFMRIISVSVQNNTEGNVTISGEIQNVGNRDIVLNNLVMLNKNMTDQYHSFRVAAFAINASGNLEFINSTIHAEKLLPNQNNSLENRMIIEPGQTFAFHFDGKMVLGNGVLVYPFRGTRYEIRVFAGPGYYSMANVTVS